MKNKNKKIDLSTMAKDIERARFKLGISLRRSNGWLFVSRKKKAVFVLRLIEILSKESGAFWATLAMNESIIKVISFDNCLEELENFYNVENDWYHYYSLQERNKNKWLNQLTRKWMKNPLDFNTFWYSYLFELKTKASIEKETTAGGEK